MAYCEGCDKLTRSNKVYLDQYYLYMKKKSKKKERKKIYKDNFKKGILV